MFRTAFEPAKIEIITHPTTKTDKEATPFAGDFLNAPQIKVTDKDGLELDNYKVIASIDRNSTDSNGNNAMIDLTDFVGMEDRFLVLTEHKTGRTDSTGIASLEKLSVLDVNNEFQMVCVRFFFSIGQTEMFIQSEPSDRVCFKSSFYSYLGDATYSRTISQNNPFANPLSLRIRKQTKTDYDNEGIMLFAAVPYMIGDQPLEKPFKKGFAYLQNNICAYQAKNFIQTEIENYKGICNETV